MPRPRQQPGSQLAKRERLLVLPLPPRQTDVVVVKAFGGRESRGTRTTSSPHDGEGAACRFLCNRLRVGSAAAVWIWSLHGLKFNFNDYNFNVNFSFKSCVFVMFISMHFCRVYSNGFFFISCLLFFSSYFGLNLNRKCVESARWSCSAIDLGDYYSFECFLKTKLHILCCCCCYFIIR